MLDGVLLALAFSAGAIAFFAPCCAGMLPAYIAYALRPEESASVRPVHGPRRLRLGRYLALGGTGPLIGGLGILLWRGLGGFAGAATSVALPWLQGVGWLALAMGIALVGAGLLALTGGRVLARGLALGFAASLGFLLVFLAVGVPVALFAHALARYFVVLAVIVGVGLFLMGVAMLAGKSFAVRLPNFGHGTSAPRSMRGFVAFGAAYAVASLGCTFPVFLAVVAAALASGGAVSALSALGAYALGKSLLFVGLTGVIVGGGETLGQNVRRVLPHVNRATAILLIIMGVYLTWYFGRYLPDIVA